MGVHLNMFGSVTAGAAAKLVLGSVLPAGLLVAAKDQDKVYPLGETFKWLLRETGYAHIQATKPDTVGKWKTERDGGCILLCSWAGVRNSTKLKSMLVKVEMSQEYLYVYKIA